MSAALVVQKAIRNRLVDTAAVIALVPAKSILDRHERPAPSPSIIIGEAQTVDYGDIGRTQIRVFHDLHIWKKESGLTGANAITGAIRTAINLSRFELDQGWHCVGNYVSDIRLIRDRDGETSHGILSVETLVQEVSR